MSPKEATGWHKLDRAAFEVNMAAVISIVGYVHTAETCLIDPAILHTYASCL